jgi:hypothetical protein
MKHGARSSWAQLQWFVISAQGVGFCLRVPQSQQSHRSSILKANLLHFKPCRPGPLRWAFLPHGTAHEIWFYWA